MRSPLPLPLLALLLLAAAPAAASVIGLDLSADYLKVALIQSGVPFEIVPNFHSKRKTDMVVTFYKDQRFYGAAAPWWFQAAPSRFAMLTRVRCLAACCGACEQGAMLLR